MPAHEQVHGPIVIEVMKTVEVILFEYVDHPVHVSVHKQCRVPMVAVVHRQLKCHAEVYDKFVVGSVPKHVLRKWSQRLRCQCRNRCTFQDLGCCCAEVPQFEYVDHPVQVQVHKQRHVTMVSVVQRQLKCHSCRSTTKLCCPVQKQVHVPMVAKAEVPVQKRRTCQ